MSKKRTPAPPVWSKVSQRSGKGMPFECHVTLVTDTCPEDGAACSERIQLAVAWKLRPVVFSDMSLSAATPEDVLPSH